MQLRTGRASKLTDGLLAERLALRQTEQADRVLQHHAGDLAALLQWLRETVRPARCEAPHGQATPARWSG